ncbi:hypothetical protein [Shimia biformata]|uniref:hypothetical protein n=1 Tax=Shimia biformata TaxID=1294299 RepID=UPI0019518EB1|nr:hypothetical protein [Shimia biformata]
MSAARCIASTLAVVTAVLAIPSPADALERMRPKSIVIAHDRGGNVVNYARRVSAAKHNNTHVTFKGKCQSACTMFLALPKHQTCISRGASFSFHRAYGASSDMNAWGTRYLLKSYPEWVIDWIDQKGGLSNKLLRMDYKYASQFLSTCSPADTRKMVQKATTTLSTKQSSPKARPNTFAALAPDLTRPTR